MLYRINELKENGINPITGEKYDDTWVIMALTDSSEYQMMCGSSNGCAYAVKISRNLCKDWKWKIGDFIGFNIENGKNIILVMSEEDYLDALTDYNGHRFNEEKLRETEPSILIHSTSMESWIKIQRDGALKSWNRLRTEKTILETQPIGATLGDPIDFRDYIMFGGGVTGEIVVNSRQKGSIIMDTNAEYLTSSRLYFDAKKMAQDGLLLRDGCHLKVKDFLPLDRYLIWAATWKVVRLDTQTSTPRRFAEVCDRQFKMKFPQYADSI